MPLKSNRNIFSFAFPLTLFFLSSCSAATSAGDSEKVFISTESRHDQKYLVFKKGGQLLSEIALTRTGEDERRVFFPKDNSGAIVVEDHVEVAPPSSTESESEESNEYCCGTSTVRAYNDRGSLMWEKSLPKCKEVSDLKSSDDMNRIFVFERYTEFDIENFEPYEQMVVYDKNGNKILSFPEKRNEYRVYGDYFVISPSGKYVAFRAANPMMSGVVLDIENHSMKEVVGYFHPRAIGNDGKFRFIDSDRGTIKEINISHEMVPIP